MTEGRCPSCGAPIAFKAGSALVQVCPYCSTVVARTGPALEARGKIGALVDTDSPLQLHAHGRYQDQGFTIVGHLQKDYGRGPWDEWYVEFDDGRTGWISESEGSFHVLFPAPGSPLSFALLEPGSQIEIDDGQGGSVELVVEEKGTARTVSAAGELPSDVEADAVSHYVDASAADGRLCTLDFGAGDKGAEVFLGARVPLEELGIAEGELRPRTKKAALVAARCTSCNAPLELRAPDRTKRVACPNCAALLDASSGKLSLLQHLEPPSHQPVIPLGKTGTLKGVEWTCIGFLVRSCEVDGVRYPWDEYLLFHRTRGFTWLMLSNGHWVFLEPIPAGAVSCVPLVNARYQKRNYRPFQSVTARTDYVLGEFYWEVEAGETAEATEYIAPPYSLNEDHTENETTWTHGEYLAPEVVKAAFGLSEVPVPEGVAPSQPNPSQAKINAAFKWALIWGGALVALFIFFLLWMPQAVVFDKMIDLPLGHVESGAPSAMYFSEPFEIPRTGNVLVEVSATPLSNSWVGIEGDLVNTDTGEVTSFYQELSYYSGVDADGAWSEGSTDASDYLSHVEAGRYTLRLVPTWDHQPSHYRVRLTSGVPRLLWVALGVGGLFAMALAMSVSAAGFEAKRWSESNLGGEDDIEWGDD
ncbi:MAG: DUF4178 domain-containing protein [Myxococcaceae bacterium]|nr:DUF4178 domain-containing protein [Myxococcaceae bacterium]